ncbi:cytochrome P450 [Xylaria grammica]|nr:cytochrome P450 [Xylaria grammica]
MAWLLRDLTLVTPTQFCFGVGAVWLLYALWTSVYRLFFHPLRHIPGPKLAALTQWVETYYECFKPPGGQFMWEYQKWHAKYGPIVRIGPNEVHIQDLRFYDTLYSNSRHSDKLKQLEHRFNNQMGTFSTPEHSLHRLRRTALNPFFSKRKIAQHSPNIQKHMDLLCERVKSEYFQNGSVLSVSNMWGAFNGDIVVGYCLEKGYDFISKPDFRSEFSDAMVNLLDPVHFITQFSWMIKAFKLLPAWMILIISPAMASVHAFNDEMKEQILRAKSVHASGEKNPAVQQSLFTALFESDLPPSELETKRLQHEAIAVTGGGLETTTYALSVASYHILSNPRVLSRLKAELNEAVPDPRNIPSLDTLMQLPYLNCVMNESLRFSYGTPQRIPRLSPTPITYSGPNADYHIPVGSIVSMDNYTASHDPWAFPSPQEFRPERWEGNPRAPDGKPLTTYMIAFGRGTRSCVGMQLGYANLYIGLVSFFRRFDCELFETERDAIDCAYDSFVPRAKPGTKGIRVKVINAA